MIAIAAFSGLLAVALGAYGAHGLRPRVGPEALASWQTATSYHLLHSAVLLALGLHAAGSGARATTAAAWLFTAGIACFSGSIYALVLGAPRWLGPVTPLGGLLLMAGWAALGLAALRGSAS